MSRTFVELLSEIREPKVSELGGKGYSLAVLMNNGFDVPKGFIITSRAFFEFLKYNNLLDKAKKLTSEINENNFREKSKALRALILRGKVPPDIVLHVKEGLAKLNVKRVAVRSSAVSEDSLRSSFAGLHDTFLNVKAEPNSVLENTKKCWASLFNERAIAYRIKKGLPHLEGMAVIIQEMIPAEVSGVAFTANPDTQNRNEIIIEATYGLGEALVSGRVTPDTYMVDKVNLKIIEKRVGRKKVAIVVGSKGTKIVQISEEKESVFCLRDKDIRKIAESCIEIEKIFKYPQDIEWCMLGGKIVILQSRAITSIGNH